MPQTLTKARVIGDFIRDFASMAYCMGSRKIHNAGAEAVTVRSLGLPVVKADIGGVPVYQIVYAGAEATADAFIALEDHNEEIGPASNSTVPRAGLERGWAVVSREGLPTQDPAGDDYDLDALSARFETMNPPVIISDNTANRTLNNLLRS